METYELENEIYAALIGNTKLMEILPNGAESIYHYASPSVLPNRYPIIVYSPISDVPALRGDNRELAHRVTIRIHVIAGSKILDESCFAASQYIRQIMYLLGYFRQQTTQFIDEGHAMIMHYFVRSVVTNGDIGT